LPTYRGLNEWNTRIDYSRLTHLSIAFANPDETGMLSFGTPPGQVEAVVEAAHGQGVKVLASLGGARLQAATWLAPASVDGFVDMVEQFLDANNLDGLDVDLEGDAVDENYDAFVQKVTARLQPKGKLVTAALAQWFTGRVSKEALLAFDFINVMAYDHCGSWTQPCEHSSVAVAELELGYFERDRSVPASKLVLGVPFYGYCWGTACPSDVLTYADIVVGYPGAADTDWIEAEGTTLSYNGEATLQAKAALSRDYGGVMMWELGQDTTQEPSLFTMLTDAL
jgi:GH18 family chitinase